MKLLKFKDKRQIVNTILELANRNKQVIYGAQSVNANLPPHLRKKTKDYDILTKNPEKSANQLADKLNKEYGKGFKVIKANYSKTFKVKDRYGNTVADYTLTTKKPKASLILGVRYANLNYQKKKINKVLKDEASSFRWDKDRDTLRRIQEGERILW